ncbi:MAG: hypothetical protein CMB31_06520 [Euryarchaeota archaeon]|nr:hypothetical protein [Euryarchaeota archaeon]|tara:strand:- start:268 stop:642 length:375 start_codon:yes stop_codon:yes gene_type:complete
MEESTEPMMVDSDPDLVSEIHGDVNDYPGNELLIIGSVLYVFSFITSFVYLDDGLGTPTFIGGLFCLIISFMKRYRWRKKNKILKMTMGETLVVTLLILSLYLEQIARYDEDMLNILLFRFSRV